MKGRKKVMEREERTERREERERLIEREKDVIRYLQKRYHKNNRMKVCHIIDTKISQERIQ
jgi:Zn-finger domain-containing protein